MPAFPGEDSAGDPCTNCLAKQRKINEVYLEIAKADLQDRYAQAESR
jgi:hypothetical protein